jgi:hypothetical protein
VAAGLWLWVSSGRVGQNSWGGRAGAGVGAAELGPHVAAVASGKVSRRVVGGLSRAIGHGWW